MTDTDSEEDQDLELENPFLHHKTLNNSWRKNAQKGKSMSSTTTLPMMSSDTMNGSSMMRMETMSGTPTENPMLNTTQQSMMYGSNQTTNKESTNLNPPKSLIDRFVELLTYKNNHIIIIDQ